VQRFKGPMRGNVRILSPNTKFKGCMIKVKALIYTSPIDSEEEFIARIVEAAGTIRQQRGIFKRTHQSLLRRWHTYTVHTVHIYSRSVCL
jgi:hypothetical protein